MLIIYIILLVLLMLIISFLPIKTTILVATLLLPFQQAFTLNIAGTVRIADILYVSALIGVFIKILLKKLNYNIELNIGAIYFIYLALGSCIVGYLLRNDIQNGLATLGDYNESRLLVNVLTPVIALLIFIIGNYAGKQNKNYFQRILHFWAYGVIMLSIYVIIQFVIVNITGNWIKMPGEVMNYNTSFAYGIRRPWGFSIEPGALGNFLFYSWLMILIFLEKSTLRKITIVISFFAVLLSFSSTAIFAIFVLLILLILTNKKGLKTRYKVILVLMISVAIIFVLANSTAYDATIGKITTDNYSKLDRQANTEILTRMFTAHPIFGIGAGNYGALRNLFSQGTLIPVKDYYDMPNVFYYGMFAEQGVVGVVLFLLFVKRLWSSAKLLNKSPIIWLIPIAVLIFSASTVTFDYMVFGFGMIIGQAQYLQKQVDDEDKVT